MTMEEAAARCGWDLNGTLRRFGGNEKLLERFVKKFPQDPTFGQLEDAVSRRDLKGVETAAHTLKGVAGNLGFTGLYEACAGLVAAVRAGEEEKVPPLWEAAEAAYRTTVDGISQIEW